MYFHLYCKLHCFWRNLLHWQNFYTAAGSDSIDKFHLCIEYFILIEFFREAVKNYFFLLRGYPPHPGKLSINFRKKMGQKAFLTKNSRSLSDFSKWQLWQIMCKLRLGLEKNITHWGTLQGQWSDLAPIKT